MNKTLRDRTQRSCGLDEFTAHEFVRIIWLIKSSKKSGRKLYRAFHIPQSINFTTLIQSSVASFMTSSSRWGPAKNLCDFSLTPILIIIYLHRFWIWIFSLLKKSWKECWKCYFTKMAFLKDEATVVWIGHSTELFCG